MYRYKIIPPILLILSLINFPLVAPVVLREVRQAYVGMADVPEDVIPVSGSEKQSDELEKRRDEYSDEPWRKRGISPGSSPAPTVGEPPASADQELASNYPPSPQTQTAATSKIQDAAPVSEPSSPEINNKLRPPSDGDYPGLSSGGSYPSLSSGGSYPSDHRYTSSENPPPSYRPEEMVSTGHVLEPPV
jgi:hypothetical protein